MPLSNCQSGQKEIQNVFLVIRWVQYWPWTRILVLLCGCCLLGLDYICSTHYTQQQKCWNTVMKRGTFSEKIWTFPPPPPNCCCCFLLAIFSAKCRPWDIRGGGGRSFSPLEKGPSLQKFFPVLRASVWSKNEGGGGQAPPLDPPLIFKCERCYLKTASQHCF